MLRTCMVLFDAKKEDVLIKADKVTNILGYGRSTLKAAGALLTATSLLMLMGLAITLSVGTRHAAAAVINRSAGGIRVLPGGMVRVANGRTTGAVQETAAHKYPSCSPRIEYKGNAGHLDVQEKDHSLQWGIVMTPYKYSQGNARLTAAGRAAQVRGTAAWIPWNQRRHGTQGNPSTRSAAPIQARRSP
jgi:hypothetical protein